jgi:isocitrate/isopropylmalate dehydrogenase
MATSTPITVAHGDGIGPEIMEAAVTHAQISALYEKVTAAGYDIVKTETLRTFDGQQGFTLAQGQ